MGGARRRVLAELNDWAGRSRSLNVRTFSVVRVNDRRPHPEFPAGVHDLFSATAAVTPEAIALTFGDRALTYETLDRASSRVAAFLQSRGIAPETRVAVVCARRIETVVTILGVLKAGGAYVPLDPSFPAQRLEWMLSDAAPALLARTVPDAFSSSTVPTVDLFDEAEFAFLPDRYAPVRIHPDHLAYIVYTSGSSGEPKGVMVSHGGLVNYLRWALSAYDPALRAGTVLGSSLAFDLSVTSLFGPLLAGGTLRVLPESSDATALADVLGAGGEIGFLKVTPSHVQMLSATAREPTDGALLIHTLVLGGEALFGDRVVPWLRGRAARVVNEYGPTETVVGSVAYELPAVVAPGKAVPIGTPIANTTVYLLDDAGAPVATGQSGEIYIGGAGVARGYFGRPALTAERFLPDPFAAAGARMYRTGDLGREGPDGTLEYLGRIDDQIKLHGYRIEPGELEFALEQHPHVAGAAVGARMEADGRQRLIAYVTPRALGRNADTQRTTLEQWRRVFDDAYRDGHRRGDFNTAGWSSSYTGLPHGDDEMREWVNATVDRVLALQPRRVLELGCGTGLLLSRIAPFTDRYDAADASPEALACAAAHPRVRSGEWGHVRVLRGTADAVAIEEEAYDLVVLNSVVQYFPDPDYLIGVLTRAAAALCPGGALFIGDVRHRSLLRAFHLSVEMHRAADSMTLAELGHRVDRDVLLEQELALDPAFFYGMTTRLAGIDAVDVHLRRGVHPNEMTRFRYDVVLTRRRAEAVPFVPEFDVVSWPSAGMTVADLRRMLEADRPCQLSVHGIPNARLHHCLMVASELEAANPGDTVGSLKATRRPSLGAVDPETVWAVATETGYSCHLDWSESGAGEYDASFVPVGDAPIPSAVRRTTAGGSLDPSVHANDPARASIARRLPGELRDFLRTRLPEFMMPSTFVVVDTLPRNANGKLDRRALPPPLPPEAGAPPRTPVERVLVQLWAEVLGVDNVGVDDNFFELGGDSILSVQIAARAAERGVRLRPGDVFGHPTLSALAAVAESSSPPKADQGEIVGDLPFTPIQTWLARQDLVQLHHWNQSALVELRRPLERGVLAAALPFLEMQHDVLRARLPADDRPSRFVMAAACGIPLEDVDLRPVAPYDRDEFLTAGLARLQTSLDLVTGPVCRAAWIERSEGQAPLVFLTIHHTLVDTVSWGVLLEDLATCCLALERGESPSLPAKTSSFQTWCEHLRVYARSDALREEIPYWTTVRTAGQLPVDLVEADNTEASVRRITVTLDEAETRALLQKVPAAYHTQINDVLLTALATTIASWTGSTSALIDLEAHGREDLFDGVDVSRTAGWFTALYPVLLNVGRAGGRGARLTAIRDQLRAVPHHGIGYGILRYLRDDADIVQGLERSPPAEISFNYLGQIDRLIARNPLFRMAPGNVGPVFGPSNRRAYLFEVEASVVNGRLSVDWIYSVSRHRERTVAALAEALIEELRALIARCVTARADVVDSYPLTSTQQGILFETLYAHDPGAYLVQSLWTLQGDLRPAAFAAAWAKTSERHPMLRTAFVWETVQEPVQAVHAATHVPLETLDWSGRDPSGQDADRDALIAADRSHPFDLERPPLFRITAVRLSPDRWQCLFTAHHLILDGWSSAIVRRDVLTAYGALLRNEEVAATPSPPFRTYIEYLARVRAARTDSDEFWRDRLGGYSDPADAVLVAGPDSARAQATSWDECDVELDAAVTARIREQTRAQHLTLGTVVIAAWAVALARHTGRDDVVFGVTVAGRPPDLPGVERMVGMFINTVPYRVRFEAGGGKSWLRRLQDERIRQTTYELTPLVDIRRCAVLAPGASLFHTLLVVDNYPGLDERRVGGGGVTVLSTREFETSNYPLNVVVLPGRALRFRFIYDPRWVSTTTVRRLAGTLQAAVIALARAPNASPVALLRATSEDEPVLSAFNKTAAVYPVDVSVHASFEKQAARRPDAYAVVDTTEKVTYGDLDARANGIAQALAARGVAAGDAVGVCLDRSADLVAALLGILKCGAVYVPLDPADPVSRLSFILRDTGASCVVAGSRHAALCAAIHAEVCLLDGLAAARATPGGWATSAAAPAYIMYTSGSTGRPKGITVPHRAIIRLVVNGGYAPLSEDDVVAQVAAPTFDAATWEIWVRC